MKDIKHIRRDFHSVARGRTWGYRGGLLCVVQKIFFSEIQPNLVCELLTSMAHATAHFFVPTPWGPGEGPKCQISLNLNYKVNFKDFSSKLCVSSHK